MNLKLLLIFPLLSMYSCIPLVSDMSQSSSNEEESSIIESGENSESIDTSNESNSDQSSSDSTSQEDSSDISSDLSNGDSSSDNPPFVNTSPIDVSEKEYYKSLVKRENITYSKDFINDSSKDISKLQIFQLNDTHGAYYDDSSITGISRVATCLKQNTIDENGVVKIANGDMLQGTAFSNMLLGEPAIAALNEMNFDAFVIGNHEFDWGLENLYVYKDNDLSNGELECPFLGANIVDKNGNRPYWIEPYTIVNKGDVKVGIIGVIGDTLESSISKLALNGFEFTSTSDAVNKYSKILIEEEKVDIVIVGDHNHDATSNQKYVNTYEIDCIINGHDHKKVSETVTRFDGKKVPVVESYTKNGCMGLVTLTLDSSNNMLSYTTTHLYPEDYTQDSNLKNIMDIYYDATKEYEKEVIGYTSSTLSKEQISVSTCTYIAKKYDVDVAMTNTGGVRSTIPAGNITNGLVYEALPFDNELYITTVTGSELKSMVSNSYYYYNNSGIGKGTSCDTSSIVSSKEYTVICVDYVATKDYMSKYFNEAHGLIKTGDYIRECAIENIKQNYKK